MLNCFLHLGPLPNERAWSRFISNVRELWYPCHLKLYEPGLEEVVAMIAFDRTIRTCEIVEYGSVLPRNQMCIAQHDVCWANGLKQLKKVVFRGVDSAQISKPGTVNAETSTLSQDDNTLPSQTSKHGQNENWHCTYSSCDRSRPGQGFYRKDHMDQHLRGVHKQYVVERVRAKRMTMSSNGEPAAADDDRGIPLRPKNRKHDNNETSVAT
jgi:hypothetical protein